MSVPEHIPEEGIPLKKTDIKVLKEVAYHMAGKGGCKTCKLIFFLCIFVFVAAVFVVLSASQGNLFKSQKKDPASMTSETKLMPSAELTFEEQIMLSKRLHQNVKEIDEKRNTPPPEAE